MVLNNDNITERGKADRILREQKENLKELKLMLAAVEEKEKESQPITYIATEQVNLTETVAQPLQAETPEQPTESTNKVLKMTESDIPKKGRATEMLRRNLAEQIKSVYEELQQEAASQDTAPTNGIATSVNLNLIERTIPTIPSAAPAPQEMQTEIPVRLAEQAVPDQNSVEQTIPTLLSAAKPVIIPNVQVAIDPNSERQEIPVLPSAAPVPQDVKAEIPTQPARESMPEVAQLLSEQVSIDPNSKRQEIPVLPLIPIPPRETLPGNSDELEISVLPFEIVPEQPTLEETVTPMENITLDFGEEEQRPSVQREEETYSDRGVLRYIRNGQPVEQPAAASVIIQSAAPEQYTQRDYVLVAREELPVTGKIPTIVEDLSDKVTEEELEDEMIVVSEREATPAEEVAAETPQEPPIDFAEPEIEEDESESDPTLTEFDLAWEANNVSPPGEESSVDLSEIVPPPYIAMALVSETPVLPKEKFPQAMRTLAEIEQETARVGIIREATPEEIAAVPQPPALEQPVARELPEFNLNPQPEPAAPAELPITGADVIPEQAAELPAQATLEQVYETELLILPMEPPAADEAKVISTIIVEGDTSEVPAYGSTLEETVSDVPETVYQPKDRKSLWRGLKYAAGVIAAGVVMTFAGDLYDNQKENTSAPEGQIEMTDEILFQTEYDAVNEPSIITPPPVDENEVVAVAGGELVVPLVLLVGNNLEDTVTAQTDVENTDAAEVAATANYAPVVVKPWTADNPWESTLSGIAIHAYGFIVEKEHYNHNEGRQIRKFVQKVREASTLNQKIPKKAVDLIFPGQILELPETIEFNGQTYHRNDSKVNVATEAQKEAGKKMQPDFQRQYKNHGFLSQVQQSRADTYATVQITAPTIVSETVNMKVVEIIDNPDGSADVIFEVTNEFKKEFKDTFGLKRFMEKLRKMPIWLTPLWWKRPFLSPH